MKPTNDKLADYGCVDEALADLCDGLVVVDGASTLGEAVDASELPSPFCDLLVHFEHMTTTLERHYDAVVELRVLGERFDGDVYRRMILLVLAGTDTVVEFGLVRVDLGFTPAAVRDSILARKIPLGRILIEHEVLRRIVPRWYLRFSACSPLFAEVSLPLEHDAFGRVGTIYCNGEPAIELLEIVTGS